MLVDSRAVVERVCRSWAERHGFTLEQVLQVAHGRRTHDTVATLAPHLDIMREVAWLDAAELADVDGLTEVAGVRRFLSGLDARHWAVVTSCGRELATLRLTAVALPIPPIVITSEDVVQGKPSPEGYQLGARRLGFEPAECTVFEDAPPGIMAAREAGAQVVALRTTHPDADFTGATAVIPDFTHIRVRRDRDDYIVTIG